MTQSYYHLPQLTWYNDSAECGLEHRADKPGSGLTGPSKTQPVWPKQHCYEDSFKITFFFFFIPRLYFANLLKIFFVRPNFNILPYILIVSSKTSSVFAYRETFLFEHTNELPDPRQTTDLCRYPFLCAAPAPTC